MKLIILWKEGFDLTLMDWLPTIVVGIATISGLIGVAVITRKQTDRQINNQNKQMHRPYFRITFKKNDEEAGGHSNTHFCCSKNHVQATKDINEEQQLESILSNQTFPIKLKIKNIGKGPAQNIYFYDCIAKSMIPGVETKAWPRTEELPDLSSGYLAPKIIFPKENDKFYFDIIYNPPTSNDIFDSAMILLLYSDINGNIYKTLLYFGFEFDEDSKRLIDVTSSEYYEENYKFRKMIDRLNININGVIEKYNTLRNIDSYK